MTSCLRLTVSALFCVAALWAEDVADSAIQFSLVSVPFTLENSESSNRYAPETMPGGVAAFDYDNDGDLDLFFANGAELPGAKKMSPIYNNRLLRNNGEADFTDVTERARLAGHGYDFGAAVADYDNDGDADLFVAGLHRSTLYRNDGDGGFDDVTSEAGLSSNDPDFGPLWSVAGVWFDYDNDGLLDLFIVNYLSWRAGVDPVCDEAGVRDYCHPKYYKGSPNSLYRNRGDGKFDDVSASSGVRAQVGKGMGAAVADFDRDGLIDVFVTNDKLPNFLLHNDGREGFEEIGFEAAVALPEDGQDVSGMGLDARDVDNDALPDIVYAALPGETFPLMRNLPGGYFEDVGYSSGLAFQTRRMAGFSALIADFDNDGWKDIFFSRGDVQAHSINPSLAVDQHNTVFENMRDGSFAERTGEAGFAEAPPGRHRGAAVGDFNGDGRLDLAVTALGAEAEVWLNQSEAGNHWLQIDLEGVRSNRDGIGAEVTVAVGDKRQMNHASTSVGYASSSAGPVHFGLGEAEAVDSVEIRWPSGQVQRLEDVAADQVFKVREPDVR